MPALSVSHRAGFRGTAEVQMVGERNKIAQLAEVRQRSHLIVTSDHRSKIYSFL
jgi:hypothetical protein